MPSILSEIDRPRVLIDSDPPEIPPNEFDSSGDDDDPIRWATVATYWNPTEAHMARIKLESEDIDCMMINEQIMALWANAVGGIKLQVPQEDLIRARELLTIASPAPAVLSGEPLFDGQVRCPRCGSEKIHTERFSRRFALLTLLLLGAPLPFLRRTQHCAACGFEWKDQNPR